MAWLPWLSFPLHAFFHLLLLLHYFLLLSGTAALGRSESGLTGPWVVLGSLPKHVSISCKDNNAKEHLFDARPPRNFFQALLLPWLPINVTVMLLPSSASKSFLSRLCRFAGNDPTSLLLYVVMLCTYSVLREHDKHSKCP